MKTILTIAILTIAVINFSGCSQRSKAIKTSPCACYDIEINQNEKNKKVKG